MARSQKIPEAIPKHLATLRLLRVDGDVVLVFRSAARAGRTVRLQT